MVLLIPLSLLMPRKTEYGLYKKKIIIIFALKIYDYGVTIFPIFIWLEHEQ